MRVVVISRPKHQLKAEEMPMLFQGFSAWREKYRDQLESFEFFLGGLEQRPAVDLADEPAVALDARFGGITCRSRTIPPGRTASTIFRRTSTTSSGSTHQSDQEKTARSNDAGSRSISVPDATR